MPDTRPERIVFLVGVATIVALALALIPAYRSQQRDEPPSAAEPAPVEPDFGAGKTAARVATPPATAPVTLRIVASRGDCWIEVRDRSSTGKVLYEGTLAQGRSVRLVVRRLWVRFGVSESVDVTLDGKPVTVPSGTVNVLVTADGVALVA